MLSGFQESFSCCLLNPQFPLSPPISCLASSPAHTGTYQKGIRQRTRETKETMALETHGELRPTSSPTRTARTLLGNRPPLALQNLLSVPWTSPDGPNRGKTAPSVHRQAHPLPTLLQLFRTGPRQPRGPQCSSLTDSLQKEGTDVSGYCGNQPGLSGKASWRRQH